MLQEEFPALYASLEALRDRVGENWSDNMLVETDNNRADALVDRLTRLDEEEIARGIVLVTHHGVLWSLPMIRSGVRNAEVRECVLRMGEGQHSVVKGVITSCKIIIQSSSKGF